jgi:hypothetical protein
MCLIIPISQTIPISKFAVKDVFLGWIISVNNHAITSFIIELIHMGYVNLNPAPFVLRTEVRFGHVVKTA